MAAVVTTVVVEEVAKAAIHSAASKKERSRNVGPNHQPIIGVKNIL